MWDRNDHITTSPSELLSLSYKPPIRFNHLDPQAARDTLPLPSSACQTARDKPLLMRIYGGRAVVVWPPILRTLSLDTANVLA